MAEFNKKTIKTITVSPIQKDGVTNAEKTLILTFEDDTQQIINGGLSFVQRLIAGVSDNLTQLQDRKVSLQGLEVAINEVIND